MLFPFRMGFLWLIKGGDPNHLLNGMILQVGNISYFFYNRPTNKSKHVAPPQILKSIPGGAPKKTLEEHPAVHWHHRLLLRRTADSTSFSLLFGNVRGFRVGSKPIPGTFNITSLRVIKGWNSIRWLLFSLFPSI